MKFHPTSILAVLALCAAPACEGHPGGVKTDVQLTRAESQAEKPAMKQCCIDAAALGKECPQCSAKEAGK